MNELIKVDYSNDRPAVSARELHEFLEVETEYRHWFPRMCEYGFTQGVDFNPFKNDRVRFEGNRTVTRTIDDAAITIDMAKEICMLQRTEKGKQARQYFLQLERDWNSPEKVMARAIAIAQKTIEKQDRQIRQLTEQNEQQMQLIADYEPKIQYVDTILSSTGTMATSQIAADYNMSAQRLNKILHKAGIQHNVNGQWILYRDKMGMGYTKSITIPIVRSDGRADTKMHTHWTQKGRLMIHELLTRQGIQATMDK